MRISVLIFAAAMLTAAPAFAQADPSSPPPEVSGGATEPSSVTTSEPTGDATDATGQQSNGQERVCRTAQRTESRLRSRRERVCRTQAEWDQMSRDAADLINNRRAAPVEN